MKKRLSKRKLCIISGSGLMTISLVILLIWIISPSIYNKKCIEYTNTIRELIPPSQNAFPEDRQDNTMPSLSIDNVDFIALAEFPAFNEALPVSFQWGNTDKYPRRFTGSVYNNTLVIGASDRTGQLDFVHHVSVGDTLFITDMTGSRYSYVVSDISISDNANLETLQNSEADLTLFVKSALSFKYTIIRYKVKS